MKIRDLYQFDRKLKGEGIYYTFSGYFSQDSIEEIGDVLKGKIEEETNNISFSIRVFSIFVEQVQNILFHSANISRNKKSVEGIIVIGRTDNTFFINCGNVVSNEKRDRIKSQIESLNTMDKDELNDYYKKQLKSGEIQRGEGAGLGLIDIARKASGKLDYDLKEIDSDHSFFSIGVNIDLS